MLPRHFSPAHSRSDIAPVTSATASAGSACLWALSAAALLAAMLLVVGETQVLGAVYAVPSNYTTIQAAVNALPSTPTEPDTILVSAGIYPERVTVDTQPRTSSYPLVIKAAGAVTVDGSDDYSQPDLWTRYNQGDVWSAKVPFTNGDASRQVFIDDARYKYIPPPVVYDSLAVGCYTYATGSDSTVYINAGGDNPGDYHTTFISRRSAGFILRETSFVTISGFTILRTTDRGIDIQGNATTGTRVDGASVEYCTSARNWGRGISLQRTSNGRVVHNVTHRNGKHGIYLLLTDHCDVSWNESYQNDDPTKLGIAGGVAGIKIGDNGTTPDVLDVAVDYNVVHDNEDTGIDLKGAKRVVVRRNVSYGNGDHGYDNLNTDSTAFINNVAARNDHDGISAEDNATNVQVYNCIFWHNGVDPTTLAPTSDGHVRELFVDNTTGFASNHNVLCGLAPGQIAAGYYRYLAEFPGGAYESWQEYRQGQADYDGQSYPSDPMFADSGSANFTIAGSYSDAVDAAKTDLTSWVTPFWLSADPRGFVPHDNDAIPNAGGAGTPNYAEIGAFEFDLPPAAITDLRADVVTDSSIHLLWTASGDDGLVGRAPSVDLRWSYTRFAEEGWASATPADPQPSTPVDAGSTQGYTFRQLPMCTLFCFGLKYGGGNGLWADVADTAALYTRPVWINGHWACDEGGGERARRAGGPGLSAGAEPTAEAGAGVGSRTAAPAAVAPTASGNPVVVEVIPASGGLDLRLMPLARDALGDLGAGGGGILYQVPDGKQGWTTRLQYDRPPGRGLALLLPERAGRWVFLDPLVVQL